MTVKLHTCGGTWVHGPHPCWKVMKALDDAGIPYEQVKHPSFPRGRRDELAALSGQRLLPVIEFEDGQTLREESAEMVARIKEGRLAESPPPSA
jgi:glutathione S-transferase